MGGGNSIWVASKDRKRDPFYEELTRLLPLAIESHRHLKKVTGKKAIRDIHPLDEKRWSDKCWQSYSNLVELIALIQDGITYWEQEIEFKKFLNQQYGYRWIGKIKVGKFPKCTSRDHTHEHLEKLYPKVKSW